MGINSVTAGFRDKKRRQWTSILYFLVPKAGLEPAHLSMVDFESTASTDFATSALKRMRKTSGIIPLRAQQATQFRYDVR